MKSWLDSVVPPTRPPFTISAGWARAKSRRVLAAALISPLTKAMAVGPLKSSVSSSYWLPAMASRTRVFL